MNTPNKEGLPEAKERFKIDMGWLKRKQEMIAILCEAAKEGNEVAQKLLIEDYACKVYTKTELQQLNERGR